MKRHNHKTDLKLYRLVFNIYFDVVNQIIERTDLTLENRKDEKKIFKYVKGRRKFLSLFEKAGLKQKRVTISFDNFICSFMLSEITIIKKQIEKRLVTPKHHLYYIDVKQSSKAA